MRIPSNSSGLNHTFGKSVVDIVVGKIVLIFCFLDQLFDFLIALFAMNFKFDRWLGVSVLVFG